eukprot:PLAT4022.1.p1 GENE.PLAT4022.1~~PLAT4022.1.p1  ORF type:complete len:560 (-),score=64.45 PLAT4022.1:62-1690(-)
MERSGRKMSKRARRRQRRLEREAQEEAAAASQVVEWRLLPPRGWSRQYWKDALCYQRGESPYKRAARAAEDYLALAPAFPLLQASSELAFRILCYCSPVELARLACVNHRAEQLACAPALWKALFVTTFLPSSQLVAFRESLEMTITKADFRKRMNRTRHRLLQEADAESRRQINSASSRREQWRERCIWTYLLPRSEQMWRDLDNEDILLLIRCMHAIAIATVAFVTWLYPMFMYNNGKAIVDSVLDVAIIAGPNVPLVLYLYTVFTNYETHPSNWYFRRHSHLFMLAFCAISAVHSYFFWPMVPVCVLMVVLRNTLLFASSGIASLTAFNLVECLWKVRTRARRWDVVSYSVKWGYAPLLAVLTPSIFFTWYVEWLPSLLFLRVLFVFFRVALLTFLIINALEDLRGNKVVVGVLALLFTVAELFAYAITDDLGLPAKGVLHFYIRSFGEVLYGCLYVLLVVQPLLILVGLSFLLLLLFRPRAVPLPDRRPIMFVSTLAVVVGIALYAIISQHTKEGNHRAQELWDAFYYKQNGRWHCWV